MPELPEVETTLRGVLPWVCGSRVKNVIVRQSRLRWPIPAIFSQCLPGQRIERIERRAKYLLFYAESGVVLMHLGMSGSLRLVAKDEPPEKHDHVDIVMDDIVLRYRDSRRFGAILWLTGDPFQHPLLRKLGLEPLEQGFDGAYLYKQSRGRSVAVKTLLMDNHVVVGVGNIYASETLFRAGIHPHRLAKRIALTRYIRLAEEVREVLKAAIEAGGTSLRDFVSGAGNPGYFKQELQVYQREGAPCLQCGGAIKRSILGQRSTFYCLQCQK